MKPDNFISNSDYATLKNDSQDVPASIVLSGSILISGSGVYETHTDIPAGSAGSLMRSRIMSSGFGSEWISTSTLFLTRNGTVLGFSAGYTLVAYIWLLNSTTFRCSVLIVNPYTDPLTTQSGTETFNFNVSTFLPPFV